MYSNREDNSFYDPLGTGEEYMGPESRINRQQTNDKTPRGSFREKL